MTRFFIVLLSACVSFTAQAQDAVFGHVLGIAGGEVFVSLALAEDVPGGINVYRPGHYPEPAATLRASDAAPGDWFGAALVATASRLVVGAYESEDGNGALYVFRRDSLTGMWTETARLTAPDDRIGSVIAAEGDLIAAASRDAPAIVVFERTEEGWRHAARISDDDARKEDRFGASVAVGAERIYVGAPGVDDGAGAVFVFRRSGDGFGEESVIRSDDEGNRSLGSSIQTWGSGKLVTAAPGLTAEESAQAEAHEAGEILVWGRDADGEWERESVLRSLEVLDVAAGGRLPWALSGDRILVGSPYAGERHGAVVAFAFDAMGGTWTETARLAGGEADRSLGDPVVAGGSLAAAASPGSNYETGAVRILDPTDLVVAGNLGLVEGLSLTKSGPVDCEEGAALQFACSGIDMQSFLPISDLGGTAATELSDIWGWTDPVSGREYALVGRTDGTSFVDITDPLLPVFLGDLPLTEGARSSYWRDIKVYADHAFIVADASGDHGMQVFDLTQLRHVADPPVLFAETARYDGISSAHNVVINEQTGFAYAVGSRSGGETCGSGLHMIDIREPASPTFAGCFADTETGRRGSGYTHDAQCVVYRGPDTEHAGREICIGSNATALSIADVTDKEHPVALSNAVYPAVAYTHQGWLTDDHAHFFMNDEGDEMSGLTEGTRTLIWDVTDLDDPQLLGEHVSTSTAIDHNLYIRGNLMYQANYMAGLRILDIGDVEAPVEVGFFDTVPVVPDRPGFFGAWSVYPFFESGSIVVSSINEGLFVLKKRMVDL